MIRLGPLRDMSTFGQFGGLFLNDLKDFIATLSFPQAVEVKKSSFKKVSTFLAEMKILGYIDIKEEKKGVECVTSINVESLDGFKPKPEFKPKSKAASGEEFTFQMPEIRQVFLVTAEVLPLFKGFRRVARV